MIIDDPRETIICGICGKEAKQARLLGSGSKMCEECNTLMERALSPKISVTGYAHPDVGTYHRETNLEALAEWEAHMIKCGWVKKRGKWKRASLLTQKSID